MKVTVTHDFTKFRLFKNLSKDYAEQIPYAISRGVNRTAYQVRFVTRRSSKRIFGKNYDKKNIIVVPSHKNQLRGIRADVVAKNSTKPLVVAAKKKRKSKSGRGGDRFTVLYRGQSRNPNLHRGIWRRVGKYRLKKITSQIGRKAHRSVSQIVVAGRQAINNRFYKKALYTVNKNLTQNIISSFKRAVRSRR